MEKICVRFMNNEKEYGAAVRAFNTKRLNTKIDIIIGVILLVGGIILWMLYGYYWIWAFMILGSVLGFILQILANYIIPIWSFRQEPKFKDEYIMEFSEEGIEFKTEHSNSKIDWSFYNKVWEFHKFYLLIYGKRMFSLIPKRAFNDETHENKFRELMSKKIIGGIS